MTTNPAKAWNEAPRDEKELVAREGKMVVTIPSFKPFRLLVVSCFLLIGVCFHWISFPPDDCGPFWLMSKVVFFFFYKKWQRHFLSYIQWVRWLSFAFWAQNGNTAAWPSTESKSNNSSATLFPLLARCSSMNISNPWCHEGSEDLQRYLFSFWFCIHILTSKWNRWCNIFFLRKIFFLGIFDLLCMGNLLAWGKCDFKPCGYFLKVTGLGLRGEKSNFYSSLLILISFAFCAQPILLV